MPDAPDQHEYPIRIAALRSGLTPHLIRAWEKRYDAVSPGRTGSQQRLYSDAAIERLSLLGRATRAGHSIGNIARLPDEKLRTLTDDLPAVSPEATACVAPAPWPELQTALEAAYEAVRGMDCATLERELHRSLVAYGRPAVMEHVLVPLIWQIGEGWEQGKLRASHEHVASAVIRTLLGNFVRTHSETRNAPVLLLTTPSGQLHELGALLAGATAVDHGWRVVYLGPNLPPEEIAGAYHQCRADALAISLVYPGDDPGMGTQLRMLRQLLPEAPILCGGRVAADYAESLRANGMVLCPETGEFLAQLHEIRRQRVAAHRAQALAARREREAGPGQSS